MTEHTAITRRTAITALVAAPAAGLAGIELAMSAQPSIAQMYSELLAVRNSHWQGMSETECEERLSEYVRLQDAIVSATPISAADVAMMYMADCDFDESENSFDFREKMAALAAA